MTVPKNESKEKLVWTALSLHEKPGVPPGSSVLLPVIVVPLVDVIVKVAVNERRRFVVASPVKVPLSVNVPG